MEYEYAREIKSESFKYGLDCRDTVPAIYSPAILPLDRGNPFIEALPSPLPDGELARLYYTKYPVTPSKEAPVDVQLAEIRLMKNIRFPLPFIPDVEKTFAASLAESYRTRADMLSWRPQTVTIAGSSTLQQSSFRSATGADTGMGLTLVGIGGIGKSATINRMLSRYPQTIVHDWGNMGIFTQIVWIQVTTPANANLSDLYTTMAAAIDEALGNAAPVYEKEIARQKSVGMKADYIARLVRLFGIGAIIMDEVQNLDRRRNNESSLDSLMTLINTTKVALVIVGTQDAMKIIFAKYYLARRAGKMIDANNYCADMRQFEVMMRHIAAINWFKEDFELTSDMLSALYEETNGIIDRMITLWMEIQNAYVMAREKPLMSAEFVHIVANRTAPLMGLYGKETLEDSIFSGPEEDDGKALDKLKGKAKEDLVGKILARMDDSQLGSSVFKRVKEYFLLGDKSFNDKTILETVESVMKMKSSQGLDEVAISKKVIATLSRKKSEKRPQNSSKKELTGTLIAKFKAEHLS